MFKPIPLRLSLLKFPHSPKNEVRAQAECCAITSTGCLRIPPSPPPPIGFCTTTPPGQEFGRHLLLKSADDKTILMHAAASGDPMVLKMVADACQRTIMPQKVWCMRVVGREKMYSGV